MILVYLIKICRDFFLYNKIKNIYNKLNLKNNF